MKNAIIMMGFIFMATALAACSGHAPYHQEKMGDPRQYQAHFPDMDGDGDDMVTWSEFKAHFPQTEPRVFKALDMNGDGSVDHDEWHAFKDAHGMRDH